MSYGLPIPQLPIEIDMNQVNEQSITLQTIDANTYFENGQVIESNVALKGEVLLYPNPANT